jgi:hypothetical protein
MPEFRKRFFGECLNLVFHDERRGPQKDEMRYAHLDQPFHAIDQFLRAANNQPKPPIGIT